MFWIGSVAIILGTYFVAWVMSRALPEWWGKLIGGIVAALAGEFAYLISVGSQNDAGSRWVVGVFIIIPWAALLGVLTKRIE